MSFGKRSYSGYGDFGIRQRIKLENRRDIQNGLHRVGAQDIAMGENQQFQAIEDPWNESFKLFNGNGR